MQTGKLNSPVLPAYDPPGSLNAFNYSYAQANLYTNGSASPARYFPTTFNNKTNAFLTWLNTVNRTSDNSPIANTGFRFNVTKSNIAQGKLVYNWTLTVPKFNCIGCTEVDVDFNFFGRITSGTNATYQLFANNTERYSQSYTTVGTFPTTSGGGCPENVCLNVTKWIGYNVTVSFGFGWSGSASAGMGVDVGEITVASIGNISPSTTNSMRQDTSNPNLIDHTTTIFPISYNNTVRTLIRPPNVNRTLFWDVMALSIYYPVGYTNLQVSLNSTQIFPAPAKVPFETEKCFNPPACSEALVALNMSDFHPIAHNSTITILSNTQNSISSLATLSAGAPSQVFAPGDTLGVKVVNNPQIVNSSQSQKTGQLNVRFFDHAGASHVLTGSQTFPVSTSTGGVFNVTLPSDCTLCGTWSLSANFTSGFDLGLMTTNFQLDQIQVTAGSFLVSGDNTGLNVQGTLTNSSGAPVPSASGLVFAVDEGTPASLPTSSTNSSSGGGLYVSNITIINAVFTQGQPLIMTFTISNPGSTSYNASVRIEHEWPGSANPFHGVYANFTVGAGDGLGGLPIIFGPQPYQAAFTLTGSGMLLLITNLKTGNFRNVPVTIGTSPVSPTESHAGAFKVTVMSKSGSSIVSANSLASPPYAYVVGLPSNPSRFLGASPSFNAIVGTSGSTTFAVKLVSDAIVGAKKLVVFALARDPSGRVIANNSLNPGFTDSTVLTASMDTVGQVVKGQSVSATLRLTSNATIITQILTVYLNLQGQGVVAQQAGITIGPGATQPVTLTFTAPSTPGQYQLSFSSPQYNGNVALASQTLQVTIVQSNLQILIPAAIGVVAAIIVLSWYLLRRQPEPEVEEATKTKPSDQKTRPAPKGSPSKSLTRTAGS